MQLKQIIDYLEAKVPLVGQEDYDNCGLLVGDTSVEISNVLVALDCTERVVEEAIQKKCELIICHHPLIFKGLKSITGQNYVERTLLKCIQHNIALYAIHTNLDNHRYGVNDEIARRIGLQNVRILAPKNQQLYKLSVYVPTEKIDEVNRAIFNAGAGKIGNYESCQFRVLGVGSFKPVGNAVPTEGKLNQLTEQQEFKVDYLVQKNVLSDVLSAMKMAHPYEEVAHDIIALENFNQDEGAGMIGELETAMDEGEFLSLLKETFHCGAIRHTELRGKRINRVAFCGGAGSFLLSKAMQNNADAYITGDFKYHEFFDADNKILIADIGHYESEQFTTNLIASFLKEKFTTFAVHLTEINTNPINYF